MSMAVESIKSSGIEPVESGVLAASSVPGISNQSYSPLLIEDT